MIAEAVLVDTSQAQAQLVQQQQQQQMQQQVQMQQQQTAMQAPSPMQAPQMQMPMVTNGTNGTTRKPGRMNSGDGCCDNARERAKDAVAKVAPCACKSKLNYEMTHFDILTNYSKN